MGCKTLFHGYWKSDVAESGFGEEGVEAGMTSEEAGEVGGGARCGEAAADEVSGAATGPECFGFFAPAGEFGESTGGAAKLGAVVGIASYGDDGWKVGGPFGALKSGIGACGNDVHAAEVGGIDPAFVEGGILGAGGGSRFRGFLQIWRGMGWGGFGLLWF